MTHDYEQFDTIQEMVEYLENQYEITHMSIRGHKDCGKSFIGEKI